MRSSQLPENALVALLRHCYRSPRCISTQQRRQSCARGIKISSIRRAVRAAGDSPTSPHPISGDRNGRDQVNSFALATSSHNASRHASSLSNPDPHQPPRRVAILGGGITGLASAYHLAKELKDAEITIYESSDRMGGWLNSKHVNVGNGKVVFEQGPRTLRPDLPYGSLTLNLIRDLNLEDELIFTPRNSPSAQNRFIYYPDRLVTMPGPGQRFYEMAWRVLTEPLFKGLISGLVFEQTREEKVVDDESVGDFVSRRFGNSTVTDNIVSAVLHGIYAGDIYQLSAKSLMPRFAHFASSVGSVSIGMMRDRAQNLQTWTLRDAELLREMLADKSAFSRADELMTASVYTFKNGLGTLSDALTKALEAMPKVQIKKNTSISKVAFDHESQRIKISTTANLPPLAFDRVISTIPGRKLSQITKHSSGKGTALPSLASIHSVTVMVVNLFYNNPDLLRERGFGYLIPRSIPRDQNPEYALGVVFDSDSSIGQDTVSGTKLTVMLGGHWWDSWTSTDYPTKEEGEVMARAVLKRHLKIDEVPAAVNVSLHRECIPQYTVGHEARLKSAHRELLSEFSGRLAVAGNSYHGVGVNNCIRAARDVAKDVAQYQGPGGITGLEQFAVETRWVKTSPV